MTYGRYPYGGVAYAGSDVDLIPTDTDTTLAVEVAFTTDPLSEPAWVDITTDVRSWSTSRGRRRELERYQPGRATIVLSNLSRQYDSVYTAGPNFGNIKPMKRIRIRETFSGVTYPVFDGFVDKWQLDYPNTGKDAIATITATDAFKVFARTDLPRSVYFDEVDTDNPDLWWPLNDPQSLFTAIDESGNDLTGTPQGNARFGGETLIVNDPGSSLELIDEATTGVYNTTFAMDGAATWSVEFWFFWEEIPGFANQTCWEMDNTSGSAFIEFVINSATSKGSVVLTNDAAGAFSSQLNVAFVKGTRYHIVAVHKSDRKIDIYVNGTLAALAVQDTTSGAVTINKVGVGSFTASGALRGLIDEFAVYETALSSTRIAAHYAAGTAPWSGDLPGARMGRVLDEASWPVSLRELDTGITTFRSAELGTDALEHLQKASETEYASAFFITRDGKARFIGRTAILARESLFTFGDDAGEIGYTGFVPDDGDEVIRNRAIISRLNGVAKTAEDTDSIDEFGRFDYTKEGLLSSTDTESANHGAFVVDQYGDQQRRITSLDLGPAIVGEENTLYPAMLGLELGNAITVINEPLGGGTQFSQVCAVEGIEHNSSPGGARTARLLLSPEFPIRTLEDVDVSTLGYAEVTVDQTSISAAADLTSLTATVTVGSGRRIKITGYVSQFTNTAGTSTYAALDVYEGVTQLNRFTGGMNDTYTGAQCIAIETPSAGSHTYKLRAESDGTVTMEAASTTPAFILVEDIGPA